MRFALLGEHPDGLDMARALAESGRHEIVVYSGPPVGAERLQRWNITPQKIGDMEEALALPNLDAIIVAGNSGERGNQLRRALQSDHHVLCVHPADPSPDIAYEADMIRKDTGKILFPLMPESLHPAFARLQELVRPDARDVPVTDEPTARPFLVEIERLSSEQILFDTDDVDAKPGFPNWDILRVLGGEIAEVMAFGELDYAAADHRLLVCGRFVTGGMFQEKLLPRSEDAELVVTVTTEFRRYRLAFHDGFPAAAQLTWIDDLGTERAEHWPDWNPWPALVAAFERHVDGARRTRAEAPVSTEATSPALAEAVTAHAPGMSALPATAWRRVGWRDEVRALELDAAARRSLEHRRTSVLDFQEVTEAASFKGTMTLVGCGLLWGSVVLLIFSIWLPWLGWFILPLFAGFLILQILRVLVPQPASERQRTENP